MALGVKVTPIQTNFNGGELSDHLAGRTDLDRYYTSVRTCQNFIPLIQGSVSRRPGWRYIGPALGPSRLIEFKLSATQSYLLEFGDGVIRFLNNSLQLILSAGSPYEISSPYTLADDLWKIKFTQKNDVMFLTHPNHPLMKLNYLGDTNWVINQPNLYPPPTEEIPKTYGGTMVLSAISGLGQTATCSTPVFVAADVGRSIVSGQGYGYITSVQGTTGTDPSGATTYTQATIDIVDSFSSTSLGTNWQMGNSPQSYFCLGTVDGSGNWHSSRKLGLGSIQEAHTFKTFPQDGGLGSPEDTFRSTDVGRYVIAGGAVGQITQVVTASEVMIRLLAPVDQVFTDTNGVIRASPVSGGAWSIEDPTYTVARGYPTVCRFFQDRLWLSGSIAQPSTYYGSVVGDYENFSKGSQDTDAIELTTNNGTQDATLWLIPFQGMLIAGTPSGEYALGSGKAVVGGNGPPITPSDNVSLVQSAYGVSPVDPIYVENQLLYVQRARKNVFEMAFSIYSSVLASIDLNLYGTIENTQGAKEIKYQQIPARTIWLVTEDGQFKGLVYKKDDQIFGWHSHITGANGLWISHGIIPAPDASSDRVAAVIGRIIGGVLTYSLEWMDPTLNVDSGSTASFASPVSSVGGLAYLAGQTVDVKVDGAYQGQKVVPASGTLTIAPAGRNIEIGLHYDSTLLTNRLSTRDGEQIQGLVKKWNTLWVRLANTLNAVINGARIPFRKPSNAMDQAVPVKAGTFDVEAKAFPDTGRDGQVLVVQDQPFPCEVLAIFGQVNIGEI